MLFGGLSSGPIGDDADGSLKLSGMSPVDEATPQALPGCSSTPAFTRPSFDPTACRSSPQPARAIKVNVVSHIYLPSRHSPIERLCTPISVGRSNPQAQVSQFDIDPGWVRQPPASAGDSFRRLPPCNQSPSGCTVYSHVIVNLILAS